MSVFDAVYAAVANDNTSSFTWTHTPVGIPSSVAIAFAGYGVPQSCTYGGVDCPMAVESQDAGSGRHNIIFGLGSPPAGAQTVVVSGIGLYGNCYSVSAVGSDPVTVFSDVQSATGNSAVATVTVLTGIDEIVLDAGSLGVGFDVVGPDQSVVINYSAVGALPCFGSIQAGSDGGVMSWSVTSGPWNLCAASIKVASAAGLIVPPFMINQAVNRAGTY